MENKIFNIISQTPWWSLTLLAIAFFIILISVLKVINPIKIVNRLFE
jgi:hypothetical protein